MGRPGTAALRQKSFRLYSRGTSVRTFVQREHASPLMGWLSSANFPGIHGRGDENQYLYQCEHALHEYRLGVGEVPLSGPKTIGDHAGLRLTQIDRCSRFILHSKTK